MAESKEMALAGFEVHKKANATHFHQGNREISKEEKEMEALIVAGQGKEAYEAYQKISQSGAKLCHRMMSALYDVIKEDPNLATQAAELNSALTKKKAERSARGKSD